MIKQQHVSVVIPALNEELAIAKVVAQLKGLRNEENLPLIDDIVVCDNGSSDTTAAVARAQGARVVYQQERGYGIACQTAIAQLGDTDIVLFVDGDDSCVAQQAINLLTQVSQPGGFDIAIGSRTLGEREAGALSLPQQWGNYLATCLIGYLWCYQVTDLGPFRAIRYRALQGLAMEDRRFGWTVEMQIKAIQQHLNMVEIPIDVTRRIGKSKISGTVKGVIGAGVGIMGKIMSLRWREIANGRGPRSLKMSQRHKSVE
ncbi:MAG: glycosyltransferase family 2 protein [Spongiibacteraceae bacterium]|nr:glycosyltransferase family 2 protein [Spongiibacteraceae bacterium]